MPRISRTKELPREAGQSLAARESVEVTAALPLVDTKSTEISKVTTKDTIEKLPLARTFSGTFQLFSFRLTSSSSDSAPCSTSLSAPSAATGLLIDPA